MGDDFWSTSLSLSVCDEVCEMKSAMEDGRDERCSDEEWRFLNFEYNNSRLVDVKFKPNFVAYHCFKIHVRVITTLKQQLK
jgi:hypothetical protein